MKLRLLAPALQQMRHRNPQFNFSLPGEQYTNKIFFAALTNSLNVYVSIKKEISSQFYLAIIGVGAGSRTGTLQTGAEREQIVTAPQHWIYIYIHSYLYLHTYHTFTLALMYVQGLIITSIYTLKYLKCHIWRFSLFGIHEVPTGYIYNQQTY